MLTCVLRQTKSIFEPVAHALPALESWKWRCVPKVRELRPLHHPTAQRKRPWELHIFWSWAGYWEWRMAFDTHQFYYLSDLVSRIILCVCQKQSLACLHIIPRFKPLGGFSGLKEPTAPNYSGGTATQMIWGGMDGKQRAPLAAPPADPVSVTYRHPPLPYQCLCLPTTLTVWVCLQFLALSHSGSVLS